MRRSQIPFLFAIALLAVVYVTIANSSQVRWVENVAGPTKELPCPRNSGMDWIVQNKTVRDSACIDQWGEAAPRRWYVGRVVQYDGQDGPYYLFEGWQPLPLENCTAIDLDEGQQFPEQAMLYIPKLARLFPFTDPGACQTMKRREVKTIDIARLNRAALAMLPPDVSSGTYRGQSSSRRVSMRHKPLTLSPHPSQSLSPRISAR